MHVRKWQIGAVAVGLLAVTGCGVPGGGGSNDAGDTEEGDGSIQILGAIPEGEAVGLNAALKTFTDETGIKVTYTPSTDFTTEIRTKVNGNDAPDIALFPQPGLVGDLTESGDTLPLDDLIDVDKLDDTMIPGLMDSVEIDDKTYGVPIRVSMKSLVWTPKNFEESGYKTPTTWDELMSLQDDIIAKGQTPWCFGAEAGADTGWVYTDWVEEIVLRQEGPEFYDDWVNHEVPFNDPKIVQAIETMGDIINKPKNVRGGADGTLSEPFGDSPLPLFTDPPGCEMHRQANFITTFFPKDVQQDLAGNVSVFALPGNMEGGFDGTPVLGGGDMATAFTNDTDVVELMEFFASPDFGAEWAKAGGWLSPSTEFDNSNYADPMFGEIATLLQDADTFRFDGSDLMPAQVGAGTFWSEMNAYVGGEKSAQEAADAIEESWRG
ncbi:putative alpha-glucosides-binding ABC transporter [Nocardioidaceae bacterium Broad-1]|nr:putative alpha-glucosides-binding ABC transporter [Nocardioidaceae bacterium Broad-1]